MGIRTSLFGVESRVSNDSIQFYSRRLYSDLRLPKPKPGDLVENPGDAVSAILELSKGRFPSKWRLEWKGHREVVA